ncbi:alkylhydroperoxidase family enzyme [Novosphingobium chloroacetimidivorans]|uniref:Alkylhydroperoxidase family enzyme n=1 Tax=Novosphingobium chloroacetimidivorans TaxID=1428314 RepID=A0A7W7KDF8_9SPHN|nr:carboxymuconolactone decarboxylase family protein [Novosphingobium chloroacetimidivorans]MBB4860786.1 alkylhydroperoxidase family enzyme [Novosphingobium chloroacetimidivorans]
MPIEWDIIERERRVVGEAPRIEPVAFEALSRTDIDAINAVRAGAGAPPVVDTAPEYMRTMIRHPELFRCQMDLGTVLYNGEIPPVERELAILRVAWLCGAPYEWGQHVGVAYRIGMSAEVVERARQGSQAEGWGEHERAILAGVEELIDDKVISDATWATLAKSWDEAQLIEFPAMVGQYVATAFVQNSLRMRLEGCEEGLSRR